MTNEDISFRYQLNDTWQLVGEDEWEYGEVVRGMIRDPKGEIYFDEEFAPVGWVWMVLTPGSHARGRENNRQAAARCVEEALFAAIRGETQQ